MEITNIIITKQATAQTDNARYQLEYSIAGGVLTRVSASIFEAPAEGSQNEVYLGNMYSDNGAVGCSMQPGVKATRYFEDFENLLSEINEDVKKLKVKN